MDKNNKFPSKKPLSKSNKENTLIIRMDSDLKQAIAEIALKHNTTVSEYVRQLIIREIKSDTMMYINSVKSKTRYTVTEEILESVIRESINDFADKLEEHGLLKKQENKSILENIKDNKE